MTHLTKDDAYRLYSSLVQSTSATVLAYASIIVGILTGSVLIAVIGLAFSAAYKLWIDHEMRKLTGQPSLFSRNMGTETDS